MLTPKVLCIAEQPEEFLSGILAASATAVAHAGDALEFLRKQDFDVIFVSLPLAGCDCPFRLLEELQQTQPGTPIVLRAPEASATEAVRLLRLGAFHVFAHGDATSLLYFAANSKWAQEAAAVPAETSGERLLLIGDSRPMQQVAQQIRLVAPRRATVLITGETGTGKELAARSIHASSSRDRAPLVCVNCSALPEALLEAELFGHVKGAFTGAIAHRVGRFEEAHQGTLFLDEIGDLPFGLQAKLLRALQEREFQRLGSSETVRVDARVIVATNANLPELVKQGKFREDLYYRLNVVPIAMPPLREHASDIPSLVSHFIEKICLQESLAPKQISHETLSRLAEHDWPGNVRQLENAVERAIVLSGDRATLFPGDFPLPPRQHRAAPPGSSGMIAVPDQGLDFERTVGCIELNILEQALRKTRGNKKLAAEMLGLKRTTLTAKLKSLVAVAGAV
ncbi:MAG TPA: sigma-54 dependent transcriptional regulator [Bryobacteraceae bacterium]|nr:sigma-54 dependent transcriptional regulator [Bryobacteraceae bacterium]